MSTILLAMFSPSSSEKIFFGLKNRGHTCLDATDPSRMKDLIQSKPIDLLLIAINKNERILTSFIESLKNTPEYSHIPVVVVMDKSNIGEIDTMFKFGADECISKPFKIANLLSKVEKVLKKGIATTDKDQNPIPEILKKHFTRIANDGRLLADISEIFTGASVSDPKARRMSSPGPDWTEIIVNSAIEPFFLGNEREYVMMRKDLMRHLPKPAEYDVKEKVLLKRTVSPLAATVDSSKSPFSSEIYGIQTVNDFSCSTLACILNSRYAHFYFQRYRPPTEGLRGVYLSKVDVQSLPIIIPEKKDQKRFDSLYQDINTANIAARGKTGSVERVKLLGNINQLVFNVFGIDEAGIRILNSLHF